MMVELSEAIAGGGEGKVSMWLEERREDEVATPLSLPQPAARLRVTLRLLTALRPLPTVKLRWETMTHRRRGGEEMKSGEA